MKLLDVMFSSVARWFDGEARTLQRAADEGDRIDWLRIVPFIVIHLGCFAVLWVGVSAFALTVAVLLYLTRMFFVTAFYHRYFSHRAFRTSRAAQFLFALCGNSAVQRGPLWWAAHHRSHHLHADTPLDRHSPQQHGFLRSHVGWFLTCDAYATRFEHVADLAGYRELRWLDRYDACVPLLLAAALYLLGEVVARYWPELGTDGPQLLVWGFFVSTVLLYHATFAVNSLAHAFGTRPYATRDTSRNNALIAVLTLGEGWHNNHHRYPGSARQGLRWWELDPTWWMLRLLAALGIIWDLKPAPSPVRRPGLRAADARGHTPPARR